MSQFPGGSSEEVGKAHVSVNADTSGLKQGLNEAKKETEQATQQMAGGFKRVDQAADRTGRAMQNLTAGINRLRNAWVQLLGVIGFVLSAVTLLVAGFQKLTEAKRKAAEAAREAAQEQQALGVAIEDRLRQLRREIEGESQRDRAVRKVNESYEQLADEIRRVAILNNTSVEEMVRQTQDLSSEHAELIGIINQQADAAERAADAAERQAKGQERTAERTRAIADAQSILNETMSETERLQDRFQRVRDELLRQASDSLFESQREELRRLIDELDREQRRRLDEIEERKRAEREADAERERAAQERHRRELARIEEQRQKAIQAERDAARARFEGLDIQAGGAEELNQILSEVQTISRRAAVQTSAMGPTI